MRQNQNKKKADRPQLRAAKFLAMTRENLQTLPKVNGVENGTISFDLPRARLLARIQLLVEGKFKVTHATASSFTPATFAPYNLLKRVQVDLNNGFSSFKISGAEAWLYNMLHYNAHVFERSTNNPQAQVFMETKAASGGATNNFKFVIDLPISLNDRDPIGLILLQNEETLVTVSVEIGRAIDLLANKTGFTAELTSLSITPMLQTFTIPIDPEALPDLSILKLVHSMSKEIPGAGLTTIKLPVGLTYRKLLLYVEDTTGAGIPEDRLTTDIEIIFNQADIPYKVNPKVLRALNTRSFGKVLPTGVYVFDFSDQGLTNYGGSRDYIDTERLTEFWVQFGTDTAGKVKVLYEVLSRLMA